MPCLVTKHHTMVSPSLIFSPLHPSLTSTHWTCCLRVRIRRDVTGGAFIPTCRMPSSSPFTHALTSTMMYPEPEGYRLTAQRRGAAATAVGSDVQRDSWLDLMLANADIFDAECLCWLGGAQMVLSVLRGPSGSCPSGARWVMSYLISDARAAAAARARGAFTAGGNRVGEGVDCRDESTWWERVQQTEQAVSDKVSLLFEAVFSTDANVATDRHPKTPT